MIQYFIGGRTGGVASRRRSSGPIDAEIPRERRKRYRTIWISDVHLGTPDCKAGLLLEFLERHGCEHLYLVGDIVDGWRLRRSWFWNESHNEVVRAVLEKSERGAHVHYVCGNHDEFLRDYVGLMFGDVVLEDEAIHLTANGRRMLVMHGDQFDACIRNATWLAVLGDRASRACVRANRWINWVRRTLGLRPWSLAARIKAKVKRAVSYVDDFETAVIAATRSRGFDAVVCGHVHHAEMREADGVLYCNDGDWVESCTALVEHFDGRLEIVRWADERETEARAGRRVSAARGPAAVSG